MIKLYQCNFDNYYIIFITLTTIYINMCVYVGEIFIDSTIELYLYIIKIVCVKFYQN